MTHSQEQQAQIVVLDVYDTIAHLSPVISGDLEAAGKTQQDFAAYMGDIARMADLGHPDWTFAEYQAAYKRFLDVEPEHPDFDLIPRLEPIRPMHSFIGALTLHDIPVGLLTNVSRHALRPTITANAVPAADYFAIMQSCRYGVAKPDQRIWQIAQAVIAERTGVNEPGRVLFIDDSSTNVEEAGKYGWRAEQFDPDDPHASLGRIVQKYFPDLPMAA